MDNNENNESLIKKAIRWWKNIPPGIRESIPPIALMVLKFFIAVAIVLLGIMALLAPVGKVQEIGDALKNSGSTFKEFATSTKNFLLYGSFASNEETVQRYEEKFYQSLDELEKKYKKEENVTIDTVLIAATLLYEQNIFDEVDYSLDEKDVDFDIYDPEGVPDVPFFKRIIDQAKVLAKYQMFTREIINVCSDSDSRIEVEPEDMFEIAMEKDGKQTVTNYYKNDYSQIVPCRLDDVTGPYTTEFNKRKDAYVKALETQKEMCKNENVTPPGGGGVIHLPMSNFLKVNTKQSEACKIAREEVPVKRAAYDELVKYFDDNGRFVCDEPFQTGEGFNGCARAPGEPTVTMYLDNKREGYYYYRVSMYEKNGKTILEELYPDMFKKMGDNEKILQNHLIIEGIYDLYETFVEMGFSSGLQVGEFFSIRTEAVENPSDPAYDLYWSGSNIFWWAGMNSQSNAIEPWAPGQCTTFVQGRVMEVEKEIGLTCGHPFDVVRGNATDWIDDVIARGNKFEHSTDYNAVRPGAVIVWGQSENRPGHVAFIEKVYQEVENGKTVTYVDFTEGNIGRGGRNAKLDKQMFKYNEKISTEGVRDFRSSYGYYFKGYIYAICTDSLVNIQVESSDDGG